MYDSLALFLAVVDSTGQADRPPLLRKLLPLFDLTGRLLRHTYIPAQQTSMRWALPGLKGGCYLLRVGLPEGGFWTERLLRR